VKGDYNNLHIEASVVGGGTVIVWFNFFNNINKLFNW